MQRNRTLLTSLTVLGVTLLSACGGAVTDEYVIENDPGHVEHIEGSDLGRVFLTPDAATRLGIETAEVTTSGRQLTVPRTAVFVDPEGVWWVYTSPRPHQFVRHEVRIAREGDDRAFLRSGPSAGTDVVTVGVAELYGVEAEVGH